MTMDEPFFLPRFFQKIVETYKDEIIEIGTVSFIPPGKSVIAYALNEMRMMGPGAFFKQMCLYLYYRILDRISSVLPLKGVYSVRALGERYSIRVRRFGDINAPEVVDYLASRDIDLIVNQAPQIFKKELLNVPRLGCINKHASLLPRYRGLYPVFRALLNDERTMGVSIHFMNEKIDAGSVIVQESFVVKESETVFDMYKKVFDIGARLMIEAIEQCRLGVQPCLSVSLSHESGGHFFSAPNDEEIHAFRKKGWKFI